MLSTYLNVADLGVEVEHCSDLNGSSEPDVVHVQTPGAAFTLKKCHILWYQMDINQSGESYQRREHWPSPTQMPAS